ncbi:MAG TPA: branched-chain amino acid ABC transporter permease [Rectinema sp.]|jgi:branched-chain amino acid transport system permease protein|nr:branched-chain amino acid ABC transporter permease [Rectinema sp.]HPG96566.1 branched-chain amino acid ABC transporter permease [Rectinema sp.]HPN03640.1 branched-chain amino acid ABC transporter permease [Rectinema sp.]HPW46558.1 branched-chain amino acid ABC transporter permease [Rectinema sp.]HQG15114.1 branched-chain amino acid ABC transporter permease [Rectinema sp.]
MSLQIIINGIALGSVYALIAVGFALIFNILKFSNFAHGSIMTASAFLGYLFAIKTKLGLFPVIIVSMLSGGILAILGELIAFRRLVVRKASPIYYFVSSITLGSLYEAIVTIGAGPNFYNYPRFFKKLVISIGNIVISRSDMIMFLTSWLALGLLVVMLAKTRIGRAVRAVSFDRGTASLMGIDTIHHIQLAFFLSGALGGLSGVFLGINYTLYPQLGNLVTKGFIASVIGGLGSMSGAVIGAVLLGLTETLLINFIGSGYAPVFTFLIMLVFLLVHPQGISGSNVQEKA